MTLIEAYAVGEPALQWLQSGGQVQVTGVTSKGVFLQHDKGGVLFLSFEKWRGPLTLNLTPMDRPSGFRKDSPPFDRLPNSYVGQVTLGSIDFSPINLRIAIHGFPGWRARIETPETYDQKVILDRLRQISQLVAAAGAGKGWSALLSRVLDNSLEAATSPQLTRIDHKLMRLKRALLDDDFSTITTIAGYLLGRGSGLTPSGDDVLIGLILGLNALRKNLPAGWSSLPMEIVDLARKKTTTLSANLLAYAAEGQADERITSCLNAILNGDLPPGECARRLLTYGGSSGGDTLLGLGLAFPVN